MSLILKLEFFSFVRILMTFDDFCTPTIHADGNGLAFRPHPTGIVLTSLWSRPKMEFRYMMNAYLLWNAFNLLDGLLDLWGFCSFLCLFLDRWYNTWRWYLPSTALPKTALTTEEEVWYGIWSMPNNKTPGTYGFLVEIYQAFWTELKTFIHSCWWLRTYLIH